MSSILIGNQDTEICFGGKLTLTEIIAMKDQISELTQQIQEYRNQMNSLKEQILELQMQPPGVGGPLFQKAQIEFEEHYHK